jgi:manganese oxidase
MFPWKKHVAAPQTAKASRNSQTSRRNFLRFSALGLSVPAAAALTACADGAAQANPALTNTPSDHGESHATAATTGGAPSDWKEMDAMHEAGVKQFPAKTEGQGNQPLAYELDGDVKVFKLTAKKVQWQVTPTQTVEAWTYNGTMPGPEIRVSEGDKVRVIVTNELDESTAVHWHGLMVPASQDGVPFITQPPIRPGETFSYEFVAKNSGSHMYHSHHNSTKQVGKGLLGAFIVEPKDKRAYYGERGYDKEYTFILNDANGGFTMNGKGFPATEPLTAKLGERILIRYMNEGMIIHPMHLHGLPQLVVAKDGWKQPLPWMCDTLNVAPGERWDVLVDCTEPGIWAFHCHVLSHAESEHGMFGMVTALIVEE